MNTKATDLKKKIKCHKSGCCTECFDRRFALLSTVDTKTSVTHAWAHEDIDIPRALKLLESGHPRLFKMYDTKKFNINTSL